MSDSLRKLASEGIGARGTENLLKGKGSPRRDILGDFFGLFNNITGVVGNLFQSGQKEKEKVDDRSLNELAAEGELSNKRLFSSSENELHEARRQASHKLSTDSILDRLLSGN